jgi:hypothetical protein
MVWLLAKRRSQCPRKLMQQPPRLHAMADGSHPFVEHLQNFMRGLRGENSRRGPEVPHGTPALSSTTSAASASPACAMRTRSAAVLAVKVKLQPFCDDAILMGSFKHAFERFAHGRNPTLTNGSKVSLRSLAVGSICDLATAKKKTPPERD